MCDQQATKIVIHPSQRADYACDEHAEAMRETPQDLILPRENFSRDQKCQYPATAPPWL
jgi:hypothetical protein